MSQRQEAGRDVVMFEPDLTETTTVSRVVEFMQSGFIPTVFGFRRARYNQSHVASWQEIDLGQTRDGKYWRRLKALARAIPIIFRNRRYLRANCAFHARNLDQLCLALCARALFNPRAILVYEVVDIQPSFTTRGLLGMALRMIERICLRRIDLLIVSSPAFQQNYFSAIQRYRGEWLLVENKLRLATPISESKHRLERRPSRPPRSRWIIGYFGLIRGQATLELMVRLAKSLPDKIELRFRGVVTTVDHAWFRSAVAGTENIHYDGEYNNPADLAALYESVDFAWALDLEDIACNSRWLLPCRFYEAGFFGVPCLAVRGFEVGQLIDRLGVGWTFGEPLEESLNSFFQALDPRLYEERCRKLRACPVDTFAVGKGDSDLCRKLEQLAGKVPYRAPHLISGKPAENQRLTRPLKVD